MAPTGNARPRAESPAVRQLSEKERTQTGQVSKAPNLEKVNVQATQTTCQKDAAAVSFVTPWPALAYTLVFVASSLEIWRRFSTTPGRDLCVGALDFVAFVILKLIDNIVDDNFAYFKHDKVVLTTLVCSCFALTTHLDTYFAMRTCGLIVAMIVCGKIDCWPFAMVIMSHILAMTYRSAMGNDVFDLPIIATVLPMYALDEAMDSVAAYAKRFPLLKCFLELRPFAAWGSVYWAFHGYPTGALIPWTEEGYNVGRWLALRMNQAHVQKKS